VYGTGRKPSPDVMIRGGVSYRIFSPISLEVPGWFVNSANRRDRTAHRLRRVRNVINDTNPGFQPFGFCRRPLRPGHETGALLASADYAPTLGPLDG